jgi:hypothetical protein
MAGPATTKAYLPYHSYWDPGLKTYSSLNPLLCKQIEFLLPCNVAQEFASVSIVHWYSNFAQEKPFIYPVENGEFPGRLAVNPAHLLRHVLVVVVLLAVGLVRRAAPAVTREHHVEASVGPAVPSLPRRSPVVRRDDAKLRQRGLDGPVVGALEPQGVGGVRGAHAQVVGDAARQRHR